MDGQQWKRNVYIPADSYSYVCIVYNILQCKYFPYFGFFPILMENPTRYGKFWVYYSCGKFILGSGMYDVMFWPQELILQLMGGPKIRVNFFLWNQNIGAKCKYVCCMFNVWPDIDFYLIMTVSGVSGDDHWGEDHWSGGGGGLERVLAPVCLYLSVCLVKMFAIMMNSPLP